jgi:hypothetical protein
MSELGCISRDNQEPCYLRMTEGKPYKLNQSLRIRHLDNLQPIEMIDDHHKVMEEKEIIQKYEEFKLHFEQIDDDIVPDLVDDDIVSDLVDEDIPQKRGDVCKDCEGIIGELRHDYACLYGQFCDDCGGIIGGNCHDYVCLFKD